MCRNNRLNDGKAEAKAVPSFLRRIVELMVLFEDCLKFPFRDTHAGVPDLDAQPFLAAAAAGHFRSSASSPSTATVTMA